MKALQLSQLKKVGADMLIRGLRSGTDYEQEENVSQMNEEISGIDTCYFRAGKFGYLSSSMVMELHNYGKDVSKYVPQAVADLLKKHS